MVSSKRSINSIAGAPSNRFSLKAAVSANLPVLVVGAAVVALAAGLHFGQSFTGRLDLMRSTDEYGAAGSDPGSEYPRTATDAHGYRLTLPRPAERIASLDWGIDEFVYSIVPPENVVVVSEYAYARSFSNVFELAEEYQPAIGRNAESVLKADPDLVIGSSEGSADFADILRSARIPVFRMFMLFTSLEEVAQNIRLTGYLTGRDAEAAKVYQEFQAAVRRAESRKPAGMPAPRILGYAGKYSYGDKTLFNDVVRALGGINVGAENGLRGYDAVNSEQVLRWNPEWIVTGAGPGQQETVMRKALDDPAIRATTAAQRGQILIVENRVFLPLSPFTAQLLDALGEKLYPAGTGN